MASAWRTLRLPDGVASSLLGKLRFLGNGLHGRVGIPPLHALAANQHLDHGTLCSAFDWLEDNIDHAGPRQWPHSSCAASVVHILCDASEPSQAQPKIGAVLAVAGQPCRVFETVVPQRVIDSLPPSCKHIFR